MMHNEYCPRKGKWFVNKQCFEFSTDGTVAGAIIAHLYGTDDEAEIKRLQAEERQHELKAMLTGMDEEQADWEEDE